MNENLMADEPKRTVRTNISTNLLMNHLNSFLQNDLQDLMLDYSEESVFVTQEETYTGINEIRGFFSNLMVHFPKQDAKFVMDKMIVQDELGFIVWHATTPTVEVLFGTDTFIIQDGKISRQTFAAVINFLNS